MTLGEAFSMGLVASCTLEGDVMLRLNPRDGVIWVVPSPEASRASECPEVYSGPVPTSGWRHYALCACPICATEETCSTA